MVPRSGPSRAAVGAGKADRRVNGSPYGLVFATLQGLQVMEWIPLDFIDFHDSDTLLGIKSVSFCDFRGFYEKSAGVLSTRFAFF